MWVCVCRGVTAESVERAIDDGATTREEVTQACRAGGDCGACHQTIEDMIEDRTIVESGCLVKKKRAA